MVENGEQASNTSPELDNGQHKEDLISASVPEEEKIDVRSKKRDHNGCFFFYSIIRRDALKEATKVR